MKLRELIEFLSPNCRVCVKIEIAGIDFATNLQRENLRKLWDKELVKIEAKDATLCISLKGIK